MGQLCPRLGGAVSTVVVGEWDLIKEWDKTMNSMLNELALMAFSALCAGGSEG
jgi:hypothetical protein